MKLKTKVVVLTLILAAAAFFLGPKIWPPHSDNGDPTSAQLVFFITLSVIESLTFGLGVSFLFYGKDIICRYPVIQMKKARAMWFSISWLMISWWPHDNLHQFIGNNLQKLLYIEYGFHFTLIVAAIVLAYCFISLYEL